MADHMSAIRTFEEQLDLISQAMEAPCTTEDQRQLVHELLRECLERRQHMEDICMEVIDQDGSHGVNTFNRITCQLDRLHVLQEQYPSWSGVGPPPGAASPASVAAVPASPHQPTLGLQGSTSGGLGSQGGGPSTSFSTIPPPAAADIAPSPALSHAASTDGMGDSRRDKKEKKERKRRGQEVSGISDSGFGFGAGGDAFGTSGDAFGSATDAFGSSGPLPSAGEGLGGGFSSAAWPSGGDAGWPGVDTKSSTWPEASKGDRAGSAGLGSTGLDAFPKSTRSSAWGEDPPLTVPTGALPGAGSVAAFREDPPSVPKAVSDPWAPPGPSSATLGAAGQGSGLAPTSSFPLGSGGKKSSHFGTLQIQKPYADVAHDLDGFARQFVQAASLATGVPAYRIKVHGVRQGL
eukprot:TRINITY_DN17854_c0_g1_i1.p1 TRINITY_DN17854_c0_g1~~TRINITY_DN17854_c0_g1_i1.p1  ORF type:complete len:406 (+),score=59.79 TRINITY_DN17854_c0_g1_i1:153-1370(+)